MYSVTIQNRSDNAQNIVLYQAYPNTDGHSLVWFSQKVIPHASFKFTWDINWGVNWGTAGSPLVPGVQFVSSFEEIRVMNPALPNGNNFVTLSYEGDFMMSPASHNNDVPFGDMSIESGNFTIEEAEDMYVATYMYGQPVLAMKGNPNGRYIFHTHPVYYMAVTDAKPGVAVDGSYVSSYIQVVFAEGSSDARYVLTERLEFLPN